MAFAKQGFHLFLLIAVLPGNDGRYRYFIFHPYPAKTSSDLLFLEKMRLNTAQLVMFEKITPHSIGGMTL